MLDVVLLAWSSPAQQQNSGFYRLGTSKVYLFQNERSDESELNLTSSSIPSSSIDNAFSVSKNRGNRTVLDPASQTTCLGSNEAPQSQTTGGCGNL